MRKRIMDAWRVLRGTHIAWVKVDPPTVYTPSWSGTTTYTSGTVGNFSIEPRAGSTDQ